MYEKMKQQQTLVVLFIVVKMIFRLFFLNNFNLLDLKKL